eukprot:2912554-Prymnesium_polylepis.1
MSKLAKRQLVSHERSLVALDWTLAAPPCAGAAEARSPVQRPVAATEHARPVMRRSTAEG